MPRLWIVTGKSGGKSLDFCTICFPPDAKVAKQKYGCDNYH